MSVPFDHLRERSRDRELIDEAVDDPIALGRMHDELTTINRRLGGVSASLAELRRRSRERAGGGSRVDVVDLGAGGLDLPRALVREWRRREGSARVICVDINRATCRAAVTRADGAPEIHVINADAFRLPLTDDSVDVAHAALFLHHFDAAGTTALLAEMARVARWGVLVNDLHRHVAALAGIRLLTAVLSRSPLIRHDAPLSVRRGFRRDELERAARDAGLRPEIRWRWAFRYVMWCPVETSDAHA